ncbi:MAG: 50S ribosomal protein L11 methyltransferase [Cyanobacteria bacterium QS_8_64_29]|nr:MAG: 50S ribosomal protein L11 methyltransferase [Cyanobacteria bacterium QS_8_64_29]
MAWWEIRLRGDPAFEESAFWRLTAWGCSGTATEAEGQRQCVRAYLPQADASEGDLVALTHQLQQDAAALDLAPPELSWQPLAEADWASDWKQYWAPQAVGERLLVCPAWQDPPPTERIVLRLDPGVAFGTGIHPTTQLALELLEQQDLRGRTLADVGCGSGILAIAALLLGAESACAVDTDAIAANATQANRDANGLAPERLRVAQGSVAQLRSLIAAPADGIACNILAPTIIELLPELDAIAHAGTWGALSGILGEQVPRVRDALAQHGWRIRHRRDWLNWSGLTVARTG